jgi:PAS domain S-box-containing protein
VPYCLKNCSGADVLDVVRNHVGTLIKQGRKWSFIEDAAQRKKAEDAIRKSEQRYRSYIEVTGELGWTTNADGEVVEDIPSWRNFTGQTFEEVKGSGWSKALHPDDLEKTLKTWKRATQEKSKYEVEYRLRRNDGVYRYLMTRGVPVFKEDGNIREWVGTCIDITVRKQMEKKLEEYSKHLEQLVEERTKQLRDSERLAAIGATAGMVGHDIRNPLQAIIGDIFLTKTDLSSLPENEQKTSVQESLSEIEKNVEYINKIVADLQDFAKPLNPTAMEIDLKRIIDEVANNRRIPENIQASIKVENGAEKIVADSAYVQRILSNLVNNAVQAMPNGGKLTVHAYCEGKDNVITVADTGVGIPEEAKSKLFTPLFTTKSKGQGFGLAVVKRMTEALGGTVTFESQAEKETKFIVRLPKRTNGKQAAKWHSAFNP